MNRPLEDFEKALLFLYVQNPPKPLVGDRQRDVMANLCFDGDTDRANAALDECKRRGLADSNNHGSN